MGQFAVPTLKWKSCNTMEVDEKYFGAMDFLDLKTGEQCFKVATVISHHQQPQRCNSDLSPGHFSS